MIFQGVRLLATVGVTSRVGVQGSETGIGASLLFRDGVLVLNETMRKVVCSMRSMFRSVLVALVAVFAVGAVVSASASAALPEFVTTAFPVAYASESGEVTLEGHLKGLVTRCKVSTSTGEIVEAHSFKFITRVHVKYAGCKGSGLASGACTSAGAASGEILTSALKAQLVYINKTAKEVGLVFKPEVAGGAFAEYSCVGLAGKVKVTGAVVAKLAGGQLGKLKSSFAWNYLQKAGIQEPVEYEEGSTKISAFLTSNVGGFNEQTGEEATETTTFNANVEVRA